MRTSEAPQKNNYLLPLIALGVVFGDIGTSPLYALRACFSTQSGIAVTEPNVLGILSLIFWSLMIVISLKYTIYVMRADNDGEGGILALMALLLASEVLNGRARKLVFIIGIFGAALFYGDAMLTPAISVLSAVEGLEVLSPGLDRYVLPVTAVILVLFFYLQHKGTQRVGGIFGPLMLVWFATLSVLGAECILKAPGVLRALAPEYAAIFFINNGPAGFLVLGAVFLVVTGGEALYADIGHFGKIPIRIAWYAVVLPSLLLNYFGQGALLLMSPKAISNPFYMLAPEWSVWILIALSTAATIIASQAVVSGAFSLTSQALQLDLLPRVKLVHTSPEEIGQVYIPFVNWVMLAGTIFLVINFKTSDNLASAYGVAIVTLMVITTLLMHLYDTRLRRWSVYPSLALTAVFLTVDLAFFGANLDKFRQGGWFPILFGVAVFLIITAWYREKTELDRKIDSEHMSFDEFLRDTDLSAFPHVKGTAIYLTKNPDGVPRIMHHNIKHNKVIHENIILITIHRDNVPRVRTASKIEVMKMADNITRVIAHYGFMESPNVAALIRYLNKSGLSHILGDTTFFLGRTIVVIGEARGINRIRKRFFAFLQNSLQPATGYLNIPPENVVEIGTRMEI